MAKECPNCGLDLEVVCLGDVPVERLVDGTVRLQQHEAAMRGEDYRHSVCIATNAPESSGGGA